jgi:hypothetical protein
MWMVAWGHGRAAYGWANAQVALAPCFTQLDIAVIQISNLPDRGVAFLPNQAYLAGRHADLGEITFFRQ